MGPMSMVWFFGAFLLEFLVFFVVARVYVAVLLFVGRSLASRHRGPTYFVLHLVYVTCLVLTMIFGPFIVFPVFYPEVQDSAFYLSYWALIPALVSAQYLAVRRHRDELSRHGIGFW